MNNTNLETPEDRWTLDTALQSRRSSGPDRSRVLPQELWDGTGYIQWLRDLGRASDNSHQRW